MLPNIKRKYSKRAEIYGDLAIITGIVSFLPVIFNMWHTKDTSNFTWLNLLLAFTSNIMWILYGLITGSNTNIISGSLYFLIYFYISIIKFKFK